MPFQYDGLRPILIRMSFQYEEFGVFQHTYIKLVNLIPFLLVKNVISVRPDSPVTFLKSNLGRETAKPQSFPLICTLGCLGVKDVTDIISRETSDIANEHKKEALGPRGFP